MSDEIRFLEKFADKLGLKDKARTVFAARFNKSNLGIDNTTLAKDVCSEVVDPSQTFQDHLKNVLIALSNAGSPHKKTSNQGRPEKGKERWKEASEWLWSKQYFEYLKEYGTKMLPNLDELCKEASKRSYRQLTTSKNPLMAAIGMTADSSKVVSLEIVERNQISKKREDIQSSDQGSSFYQPTENEQGERFPTTDKFLDEVIRDHKTNKSQGLRIAITGEAGAGKTTLLQSVGIYLEAQKRNLVPIWISLKQVTKTLDAYLADEYLREVTEILPNIPLPFESLKALNDLFKSGRVVLLLDGADESTEQNILGNLDEQLQKTIFNNVQVILTCRINIWDAQWRSSFDVYRIVPFTYPDQVENFIDYFSWGEGKNIASSLKEVLKDESKSRLRDIITNPLRLALLCYLWKNGEESLPDTRAELYRSMLQAFYKQKEREFGEPSNNLEDVLSKLALEALNREDYKYLLPERYISKFLGNLKDESSLFWQATKKFGLLNQVGRSSRNLNENTYAFYHPSFQEYFAALAINDWDFFLPRNHIDRPVQGKQYCVFEPSWREVVLIWSGMYKNLSIENEVSHFIEKLLTFNDGCALSNDYKDLGYFVALDIALESQNSQWFDIILDQIIQWAFGYLDQETQKWIDYYIDEEAKLKLRVVPHEIIIKKLSKLFPNLRYDKSISDVSNFLLSLDRNNSIAIEYLFLLIHKSNPRIIQTIDSRIIQFQSIMLIKSHQDTIAKNSYLIKVFVEFIFSLDVYLRYFVFSDIQDAVLSKLIYSLDENKASHLLEEVFIENPSKLTNILEVFDSYKFLQGLPKHPLNSADRQKILEEYEKINSSNRIRLDNFSDWEEHEYEDENELEEIICCKVREIIVSYINYLPDPAVPEGCKHHYFDIPEQSFNIILQILKKEEVVSTHHPEHYMKVDYEDMTCEELCEIAVESLSQNINNDDDFDYYYCYLLLFRCAQNLSYQKFYRSWHSSKDILYILESQFVDCDAIQTELEHTTEHPEIRCLVVDIHQLEQESTPDVIAEEIGSRIFNCLGRRIPEIQRVTNLKRELLNLQFDLGVEKLAIALYGSGDNEAIAQLCQAVAIAPIHIRSFTGVQATEQLVTQIKAWLSEI